MEPWMWTWALTSLGWLALGVFIGWGMSQGVLWQHGPGRHRAGAR